ncbi:anti-sigma factor [Flaviflagellibacter deserti]|jgi:anti-sigma-K factor RskA|uniref:Anti-sigma factor domain-containing protein n=1 Tax=Flaviflagellibacter deserti TaxID=2267266 RepID=A0ABV9Z4R7_9HYPH
MSDRDIDALAGEYVLGLTEPEESERIERALSTDHALAQAIAAWRERLSPLDEVADRVEPSAVLWERIRTGIGQRAVVARTPRKRVLSAMWHNLGFWRGSALAGALASFVLAMGLGAMLLRPGPAPVVVAILEAADSTPGAIVEAYADGSVLLRPLTDIDVPEGKILQVWTLWDRGVGPVPLGLLDAAHEARMNAQGQPVPQPRQLYEITLEPAGGSPTGKPTGPVLYKGLATQPL